MNATTGASPGPSAASGSPHGSYVDTNELARILDDTRVLRLALNVLYDHLTLDAGDGPVEDLFARVHDLLTGKERWALTQCGFAEHYVVIRPLSPASLPGPQALKEITGAVRTLQRHGMLVQAPDVLDRDDEC